MTPIDNRAGKESVVDSEVLRTPLDSRRVGAGFPGEGFRRRAWAKDLATEGRADGRVTPGRPAVWHAREAKDFKPEQVWGMFPVRFVPWALSILQVRAAEVLHVCSGGLGSEVGGLRVDVRRAAAPDVVADGAALPFRDESFAGVLIDPPYSVEYAHALYNTDYPRPSHLLKEAARVVCAGGRVGFLHFLVPKPGSPLLKIERIYGVTQGCGYRIRAFTVLRKRGADLFAGVPLGSL